jgi:hypothetical protein
VKNQEMGRRMKAMRREEREQGYPACCVLTG